MFQTLPSNFSSPKTSKKYSVISNEVRLKFINLTLSKKVSLKKVLDKTEFLLIKRPYFRLLKNLKSNFQQPKLSCKYSKKKAELERKNIEQILCH